MNPRPDLYRPAIPDHLIGPARRVCTAYLDETADDMTAGRHHPFKLLLLGEPGIGKSTVARILAHHLAGDAMNIEHLNGTDLTIDKVRQVKSRFGLATLFGQYQGLWIDELDKATKSAQVDMLTMLDCLPDRWFFIGTTNENLDDFEGRFQTRFEQVKLGRPGDHEIRDLLTGKFGVPEARALEIATLAAGNVRAALLDAKQWFTANPHEHPQAA